MENRPDYYIGYISKVEDPDLYLVRVTIPGLCNAEGDEAMPAYPMRGEVDEPKINDMVLVHQLDPVFGSVLLYSKLKENQVIGFRSRGKEIIINEDEIVMATFDSSAEYKDEEVPEYQDWIKIDKEGNFNISMRSDAKISIDGDCRLQIGGDCLVSFQGAVDATVQDNCNITVNGNTKINCPGTIELTGGGTLQTTNGGTCAPMGMGGFCAIPVCPYTGAPHVGYQITGI